MSMLRLKKHEPKSLCWCGKKTRGGTYNVILGFSRKGAAAEKEQAAWSSGKSKKLGVLFGAAKTRRGGNIEKCLYNGWSWY